MMLAHEIVSIYHSPEAAIQAQDSFVKVFQQKDVPDEMPVHKVVGGQTVLDVLLQAGLVSSKSEARRLADQNGIRQDGVVQSELNGPAKEGILQVGKRKYLRVVTS
jgi:tyrosyl-tRNA synthetase